MRPRNGIARLRLSLIDETDAAVAAVHGFDQAGLDERLDVFVQRAARAQAKGLAEFVVAGRVVEVPCIIEQVMVDLGLALC